MPDAVRSLRALEKCEARAKEKRLRKGVGAASSCCTRELNCTGTRVQTARCARSLVRSCACACACARARARTRVRVRVRVRVCVHVRVCMCACVHTRARSRARALACTCACACVRRRVSRVSACAARALKGLEAELVQRQALGGRVDHPLENERVEAHALHRTEEQRLRAGNRGCRGWLQLTLSLTQLRFRR
eukprot:4441438-Pleurochrysis_carterae.AAC.4